MQVRTRELGAGCEGIPAWGGLGLVDGRGLVSVPQALEFSREPLSLGPLASRKKPRLPPTKNKNEDGGTGEEEENGRAAGRQGQGAT